MKTIPLTKGYSALVDDDDFCELSAFKWFLDAHGYAKRSEWNHGDQKYFLMHRCVMSAPKGVQVDHIDGNRINNSRSNLRLATISQQRWNQGLHHDNQTGFKGVGWTSRNKSKPFVARIAKVHLGYFATAVDAADAYDRAAIRMFGDYARTNALLCQSGML